MSETGTQTTSMTVLDVRGIRHSYGNHRVLTDVTFSVGCGQIVGIVGENGSGKTTLLKILAGLLRPDGGRVHMEGKIGYCPQGLLLYEGLTVKEHFRLFSTAHNLDPERTQATALLRTFRFGQYLDRRVAELSEGTQQKLNLSLAVLHSPDLLILDEPYSGFDMDAYLRFWDYARAARASRKSLLIVSHIAYDRRDFDSLYELRNGALSCV